MHGAPRLSDLTVLAVTLVAMALLGAAAYVASPPPQDVEPRGSTFGTGRDGAKAAFLLLQRQGYEVRRTFEAVAHLPLDPSRDMLVLASPAEAISDGDRAAAKRFVEEGGLLLATGQAFQLLPHAGFQSPGSGHTPGQKTYRAVLPSPLTAGAPTIRLHEEARLAGDPWPYVPVYDDGQLAGVLAAHIGRGRVVWWAGSDPLLNGAIDEPGHLELVLGSVGRPPGERRVLWAEYYHGYTRSLLSYAGGTPLAAGAAQLALLGIAALVTVGRRHGPSRPIVPEPRTSPLEFVDAVAALYRKAGAAAGAVEVSRARMRRMLASATGLPASSPDDLIVGTVSQRYPIDRVELARLFAVSRQAADGPRLGDRQALALVRRLQEVAETVGSGAGR